MNKIVELLINVDELEFEGLGVDIMSLVKTPAIGIDWMAFSEEEEDGSDLEAFASITDYPQGIQDAAERGIRLNEEVGNKCATQVGKVRAQQLAQGKPISEETVKRMYSYLSRAAVYYDSNDTESCGTISYLLWGGEAALSWSERMVKQWEEMAILELAQSDEFGEYYNSETTYIIDGTKANFANIGDYLKGVAALDILGRNVKKDEKPETKFRYSGPPAERNFCKAMQRLNKVYTKEEIDTMSQRINTGFRHRPSEAYSLFNFKGGVNCKHYWEELSVFRGAEGEFIMISRGAASGRAGEIASNSNNHWRMSAVDEQQIIVGPAMTPNVLILRKDEMGNPFHVFFSKETIRNIAEKFLKENKAHNTDINHNDDVKNENTLYESWIVEDKTYDKSKLYGFDVPVGTWMVSYKINNQETWNAIKSGELRGFSIAGNFIEKVTKAI